MSGKTTDQIYKEVTDNVIAALEKGTIPWDRPWVSNAAYHRNLVSKREYRGVNPFLLDMYSAANGFTSSNWLTYNQANKISYKLWLKEKELEDTDKNFIEHKKDKKLYKGVKKGEKSNLIIFWKRIVVDDENEDGEPIKKTIPLLKHINIFNVEQTGLDFTDERLEEREKLDPVEEAEKIIEDWADKPPINFGGNSAFYIPNKDQISIPEKDNFKSIEYFYKTLFHESIHATGHKGRLNRNIENNFGNDPYAKEELVAEMGASMLIRVAGIENKEADKNTEAYIQNWISKLKDDPKLIIKAGGKAQAAVDYILDNEVEYDN
jgi:antirestriction protein ArdC